MDNIHKDLRHCMHNYILSKHRGNDIFLCTECGDVTKLHRDDEGVIVKATKPSPYDEDDIDLLPTEPGIH